LLLIIRAIEKIYSDLFTQVFKLYHRKEKEKHTVTGEKPSSKAMYL